MIIFFITRVILDIRNKDRTNRTLYSKKNRKKKLYPQICQHIALQENVTKENLHLPVVRRTNRNKNNNKESHKRQPCKRSQVYYGQQNEKQFEKYV